LERKSERTDAADAKYEERLFLAERSRIDKSSVQADHVMEYRPHNGSVAQSARSSLLQQHSAIQGASSKLSTLRGKTPDAVDTLPAIGSVIFRIRGRKRRDSILVGLTVGLLICLVLFYATN
jgi:hypothetical protein